jgi:hypothetical protein
VRSENSSARQPSPVIGAARASIIPRRGPARPWGAQQLVDVAAFVEAFVGEELELGGIFGAHAAATSRWKKAVFCAAP